MKTHTAAVNRGNSCKNSNPPASTEGCQTYSIRFERLVQEVAYVEIEAYSLASALEASAEIDPDDLNFEFDDIASPERVYGLTASDGETLDFNDVGKGDFGLRYEDLRDFVSDVARIARERRALVQGTAESAYVL
ncbi:MAG: hypothetical protein WCK63_11715 [Betaproteobacteria bacterium]